MNWNTRLRQAVSIAAASACFLSAAGCNKTEPAGSAPQSFASAPQPAKPTPAPVVGAGQYSPNVGQTFPDRVYWGVAHVHTGYSFDSGMFGVTLSPDDLFKVATGGEVVMDNGVHFKQDRPLDWVSITDHAEYMGISDQIRAGSPDLLANPQGKRWYEMSKTSPQEGVKAAIEAVVSMQIGKPVFDASKLTARPGPTPPRRRRSRINPACSPRCTASSGPPRLVATTFIAPWSSATARTA